MADDLPPDVASDSLPEDVGSAAEPRACEPGQRSCCRAACSRLLGAAQLAQLQALRRECHSTHRADANLKACPSFTRGHDLCITCEMSDPPNDPE